MTVNTAITYTDCGNTHVGTDSPSVQVEFSPSGFTGIGTSNPSANLHIVGNGYDIRYVLRIAEETWEELYDCYVDGEFKETLTRGGYYGNFLLVPDVENPNDWEKLVLEDCRIGIGA